MHLYGSGRTLIPCASQLLAALRTGGPAAQSPPTPAPPASTAAAHASTTSRAANSGSASTLATLPVPSNILALLLQTSHPGSQQGTPPAPPGPYGLLPPNEPPVLPVIDESGDRA